MNTDNLNPIHRMLRFSPEHPKDHLTITVREADNKPAAPGGASPT